MENIKIENIKYSLFHIIPNFACNLDCSHCDQKHKISQYQFNEEKFFETLNRINIKENKNSTVLFGGEPLLNSKTLIKKILDTGKITSMTSNFLLLDEEFMKMFIEKNIGMGTSWNPDRMTDQTYEIWKSKIRLYKEMSKRGLEVFITLTDDLIDNNQQKLFSVLKDLDELKVTLIQFSMVIPTTPELVKKADNFLCYLVDHWPYKNLKNRVQNSMYKCNGRKYSCRGRSYTLYPDGTLDNQCTHNENPYHWNGFSECKDCEFFDVCSPCPKQPCCAFYKKLYIKIARTELLKKFNQKKQNVKAQ